MKNFIKFISIVIVILFILFFIPLLINVLFKVDFNIWWFESEWSAGDALNFFGSILSFVGTIALGAISIWQTHKANIISEKLLEKDLLESTDFIKLENKIDIVLKENNTAKIVISGYDKIDFGANILIEKGEKAVSTFNQYNMRLYFFNSLHNNHIKAIKLDNISFFQSGSEVGRRKNKTSGDPTLVDFDFNHCNDVFTNWTNTNEFFVQFKMYCNTKGNFNSMMKNKVDLCIMFQFNVYSLANVRTKINYRMWISKGNKNAYEVINTNSTIVNSEIIKN